MRGSREAHRCSRRSRDGHRLLHRTDPLQLARWFICAATCWAAGQRGAYRTLRVSNRSCWRGHWRRSSARRRRACAGGRDWLWRLDGYSDCRRVRCVGIMAEDAVGSFARLSLWTWYSLEQPRRREHGGEVEQVSKRTAKSKGRAEICTGDRVDAGGKAKSPRLPLLGTGLSRSATASWLIVSPALDVSSVPPEDMAAVPKRRARAGTLSRIEIIECVHVHPHPFSALLIFHQPQERPHPPSCWPVHAPDVSLPLFFMSAQMSQDRSSVLSTPSRIRGLDRPRR